MEERIMSTPDRTPVTGAAIKQAIETRDGRMLAGFYADHAVAGDRRNNPPSRPREVRGKAAISAFWTTSAAHHDAPRRRPASPRATSSPSQACTYRWRQVFCASVVNQPAG
jgi:hypothetical protein